MKRTAITTFLLSLFVLLCAFMPWRSRPVSVTDPILAAPIAHTCPPLDAPPPHANYNGAYYTATPNFECIGGTLNASCAITCVSNWLASTTAERAAAEAALQAAEDLRWSIVSAAWNTYSAKVFSCELAYNQCINRGADPVECEQSYCACKANTQATYASVVANAQAGFEASCAAIDANFRSAVAAADGTYIDCMQACCHS